MIRHIGTLPAQRPVVEPLAVFADVAPCDGPRSHELRIVSDGARAYAYGTAHDATDCGTVLRSGVLLTVDCNQPDADDVPCPGRVQFSIDTAGTWTADPTSRRLLAEHGEAVER